MMRVSVNTIRQYTKINATVEELVGRINRQLGGVEEVIDLNEKYKDIHIVSVVEAFPLEGSDHLNITKIDDGGVMDSIDRDERGLIQVVCGAPNVHAGMLAVWLAPGVIVPETFNDSEPFVLDARTLRGVKSNGMLASPKELGFGDSHAGILEIDPSEWKPSDTNIQAGTSFAEAYGLDDTIIDIENKMFTHRPDCFGQLGVIREIAGIFGEQFTDPEWYSKVPIFEHAEGLELIVKNHAEAVVPRFMAVAIKNVTVKPSPVWLQAELVRFGAKPINNIVDVTNYVMLLTAQPTHAYDYDMLRGHTLQTRMASEGESVELLNGKTYTLTANDIVIADEAGVIGLGGIMGGAGSQVTYETKNIVLEVATFDMYTLRRTSMRNGLFTDASTRFTKGQSPLQNDRIIHLLMQSVKDVAGGEQASQVSDMHAGSETHDQESLSGTLTLSRAFITQRLGIDLSLETIETLLRNVHFTCTTDTDSETMHITAPFWRTDITIAEDIVEEVGRLYGFDKLPQIVPSRSVTPAAKNERIELKKQIRTILSRAGANEILTYSFVHKNLFTRSGQNAEDAYQLSNALSPDLHYYRRTVLPSVLDKMHANSKAGYGTFALFEIGKGHKKSAGSDESGIPLEQEYVSLVLSDGGFYQAKAIAHYLSKQLGVQFDYVPVEQGKLFEPKRSALLQVNGAVIGAIGEFRSIIKKNFKLNDQAAGFEIDFNALVGVVSGGVGAYAPLSKYPGTWRDVTFQVGMTTAYGQLAEAITSKLPRKDMDVTFDVQDIYSQNGSETKNITVRFIVTPHDKTLSSDEANDVINSLSADAFQNVGAVII